MKLLLASLMIVCTLDPASMAAPFKDSVERSLSAADFDSIQAALDANSDRMIFVPSGDYLISTKIRIRGERSGLFGHGRIIQQDPNQPTLRSKMLAAPKFVTRHSHASTTRWKQ